MHQQVSSIFFGIQSRLRLRFHRLHIICVRVFFLENSKSNQLNHANQSLITGQTTMFYGTTALTIVLYDNGLLRFLSEQVNEHRIREHGLHYSQVYVYL